MICAKKKYQWFHKVFLLLITLILVSTKKAMQQIPIAHENVEKEVREIVLNHIVSEVQRQQQLLEG